MHHWLRGMDAPVDMLSIRGMNAVVAGICEVLEQDLSV